MPRLSKLPRRASHQRDRCPVSKPRTHPSTHTDTFLKPFKILPHDQERGRQVVTHCLLPLRQRHIFHENMLIDVRPVVHNGYLDGSKAFDIL